MQFPGAMQINHTGQREGVCDGRLKCGQGQGKLAAGGVPGNADAFEVKRSQTAFLECAHGGVCAADVFKGARPSASTIAHAPVFHIPGGNADLLQSFAQVAAINQVVLRPPVSAMNKEDGGKRTFAFRYADICKLVLIMPVGHAHVSVWRFGGENVFALHGSPSITKLEQFRVCKIYNSEITNSKS